MLTTQAEPSTITRKNTLRVSLLLISKAQNSVIYVGSRSSYGIANSMLYYSDECGKVIAEPDTILQTLTLRRTNNGMRR